MYNDIHGSSGTRVHFIADPSYMAKVGPGSSFSSHVNQEFYILYTVLAKFLWPESEEGYDVFS
jgi:hypothetical protein